MVEGIKETQKCSLDTCGPIANTLVWSKKCSEAFFINCQHLITRKFIENSMLLASLGK